MLFLDSHFRGNDEIVHYSLLVNTLQDDAQKQAASLELQRVIGHPAAPLEEGADLVEDGIQSHHDSSTCASAASAWGSQKVISIVRYSAMAADSSGRACSPLPIWRASNSR